MFQHGRVKSASSDAFNSMLVRTDPEGREFLLAKVDTAYFDTYTFTYPKKGEPVALVNLANGAGLAMTNVFNATSLGASELGFGAVRYGVCTRDIVAADVGSYIEVQTKGDAYARVHVANGTTQAVGNFLRLYVDQSDDTLVGVATKSATNCKCLAIEATVGVPTAATFAVQKEAQVDPAAGAGVVNTCLVTILGRQVTPLGVS